MKYGYAKVETLAQSTIPQWDMLKAAGIHEIFAETDLQGTQPGRERMLSYLEAGDELVVCNLDRLDRQNDLESILMQIETKGCTFRSLEEPIESLEQALDVVRSKKRVS